MHANNSLLASTLSKREPENGSASGIFRQVVGEAVETDLLNERKSLPTMKSTENYAAQFEALQRALWRVTLWLSLVYKYIFFSPLTLRFKFSRHTHTSLEIRIVLWKLVWLDQIKRAVSRDTKYQQIRELYITQIEIQGRSCIRRKEANKQQ